MSSVVVLACVHGESLRACRRPHLVPAGFFHPLLPWPSVTRAAEPGEEASKRGGEERRGRTKTRKPRLVDFRREALYIVCLLCDDDGGGGGRRAVPGLHDGKALYLFTTRKSAETKGGLLAHTVLTRAFKDIFAPGAVNAYRDAVASPGEVFLCPEDNNQVVYCHLLCGLLHRLAIVRLRAIFGSFLVRALRYFVKAWPAMCDDIRRGRLSPAGVVKDPGVRAAVDRMLQQQANPRLADEIQAVMSER